MDRQFCCPYDAFHTSANFSFPYNQPLDVTHQSSYGYLSTAPLYMSRGCAPQCVVQVPNSVVPNAIASFSSGCPPVGCQSVLPEKQWCCKPEVGSTSCYAPITCAQVFSPLLPSPLEGNIESCMSPMRNCGKSHVEDCSRMSAVDFSSALSSANSTGVITASITTTSVVVSGSDSKTDVFTSGSELTVAVTSSASPVTPRPKCGRAKTNAELKRQLMERREQRLRDMQDANLESILPSCTSPVVSPSPCKQTEASSVLVS